MEEEFVKAVGQRGEGGTDLGGVHAKRAVDAPEGVGRAPAGGFAARAEVDEIERAPEKRGGAVEHAGFAETDPAVELRADGFEQRAVDEGVGVEMMVRVDEAAGEAGALEEFPLGGDFAAHEVASARGKADGETGAGG